MSERSALSASNSCPTRSELIAFVRGEASGCAILQVEAHVSICARCMAEVDQLEEQSDVVVRAIAAFPASIDDEQEFQRLQSELLSRLEVLPEPLDLTNEADTSRQSLPSAQQSIPNRLGAYELLDEIGRGATGEVYRVRHQKLDRVFAMKVLYQEHSADVEALDRFLREMKAVGKLDHPHIVRATDAGEDQGYQYLVMEYSAGLDVSEILRRLGPLSIADACEIARQAALGIQHAHQCGVIHRDVKPSNLLLTAEGQVKLLDLGLVAVRHVHPAGLLENYPRGTADYMAPEQWTDYANVDERADLYSLGCTLFRMLAGVPPFHPLPEEFASKMTAHLSAEIPRLGKSRADVPVELERLVSRLLAKLPNDRYQSDQALIDDLRPLAGKANLRLLAAKVGLLPQGNATTQSAASASEISSHRRINRRKMLLGGAAAISLGSLGAFDSKHWWSIPPKINTKKWRQLKPISSAFLLSLDNHAKLSYQPNEHSIQIDSSNYALVNLGRPLTAAFSFRTVLRLLSEASRAGVFFRYREAMEKGGLIRGFHVLELLPKLDRGSPRNVLEWSHVVYQQSPDVRRTILASTFVEPVIESDRSELIVTLGAEGFPGIVWNGITLPESRWMLTRDGRHKSQMTKDRLRMDFMGCLGVFALDGAARFLQPELMYHDPH